MGRGRGPRVRRWWWAVPVAAMGVLSGCSSTPPVAADKVVVIGDSDATLQESTLSQVLTPRYHVTGIFRPDGRIGPLAADVTSAQSTGGVPIAVIVNAGANEALRNGARQLSQAPFAPMARALSGVPCVVLTTVSRGADERSRGTEAVTINDEIKALSRADPTRVKVVDWENFLVTLEPASRSTYLNADLVHPTQAGARWLAHSDLAGIESCGSPTQPTVVGPTGS